MAVSLPFQLSDYVMDPRERKRQTRKVLCEAKRKDRLISGYVKCKYPEVYAEALECYESLNAVYPTKRDLSKTVEYLQLTTGAVSYTKYYNDRKAQKKRQEKQTETTAERQEKQTETTTKEMALRIPLLPPETVQSQETLDIPGANNVTNEIMQDPELRSVFQDMTTTDTALPDSLEVKDQTYQDLVQELVKDPMLVDVFEDIHFDDPTPLEMELSDIGL